jgi:hypothetical protein
MAKPLQKDPVQELQTRHIESDMKTLFDHLVDPRKVDVNRLPEEVFVSGFLPYFCGEMSVKENNEFFSTWIGIAGSPSSEVAIIDKGGKELFRVPPLLDTTAINNSTTNPLSEIFDSYRQQASNIPVVAEKYLATEIEHKLDEIKQPIQVIETKVNRWNGIFERYHKNIPNPARTDIILLDEEDDVEYD